MEITLTPQWLPLHVVVLEKCKFKVKDWLATGSFDINKSVFWQNQSRNNSQWVNITPSACLTTSDGLLIGTSKNMIPPAGASWLSWQKDNLQRKSMGKTGFWSWAVFPCKFRLRNKSMAEGASKVVQWRNSMWCTNCQNVWLDKQHLPELMESAHLEPFHTPRDYDGHKNLGSLDMCSCGTVLLCYWLHNFTSGETLRLWHSFFAQYVLAISHKATVSKRLP